MRRGPHAQHAVASLLFLFTLHACYAGSLLGVPENITVTFLSPTSVRVSWSTNSELVEKYDVTYKPTEARVVLVVAGNSEAVTLSGLEADTQYQVTVAAVAAGHKYRSRPIVFRTLEPPQTSPKQTAGGGLSEDETGGLDPLVGVTQKGGISSGFPDASPTFPTIRGVEVGIVVFVLIVWIGAIALFFNRWGKIRMLLPYQPDYKQEQLKVPGTGVCNTAAGGTCGTHSAQSACSHLQHWSNNANGHMHSIECEELLTHRPHNRPRVNSAIFMSAEPVGFAGFEPGDFLRRYGSQSKLCRKARSADDIPMTTLKHESIERPGKARIPTEEVIKEQEECGSKSELSETESVVTVKHFGLPILSVSGPSPPDEDYDKIDEYL